MRVKVEYKRDVGMDVKCGHKRQSKGGDTGRAYLAGDAIYRHTTDARRRGQAKIRIEIHDLGVACRFGMPV